MNPRWLMSANRWSSPRHPSALRVFTRFGRELPCHALVHQQLLDDPREFLVPEPAEWIPTPAETHCESVLFHEIESGQFDSALVTTHLKGEASFAALAEFRQGQLLHSDSREPSETAVVPENRPGRYRVPRFSHDDLRKPAALNSSTQKGKCRSRRVGRAATRRGPPGTTPARPRWASRPPVVRPTLLSLRTTEFIPAGEGRAGR